MDADIDDDSVAPIVSAVVITEVKDETPDTVIDNNLADYYKTLPMATMKSLSLALEDDDTKQPQDDASGNKNGTVGVAVAEISHHATNRPASSITNQFRVLSRQIRSESRSSSFESTTSTEHGGSASNKAMATALSSGLSSLMNSSLGGNNKLRLERFNEAKEMRVTQQVTSPIHLKVITSRNRFHMRHVRSVQEFRSNM